MRRFLLLAALVCLPVFSACNQGSTPVAEQATDEISGGVAVIDLDEVARLLGREMSIKQSLTVRENSLNQELETLRVSYANQINQRKQELPEQAAGGDLAQVQAFEQQALNKIQQARQQAQNDLNEQKRILINAFREEVKPVASKVAASKGLSLVVSKNESFLFAFDSAVDITKEVVAQMQTASLAEPAEEASPTIGSTNPQLPSSANGLTAAHLPSSTIANQAEPGLLPAAPDRPLRRE